MEQSTSAEIVTGDGDARDQMTTRLHEMSLMITRLFNRRVRDLGLTRTQWQVLYLLYAEDGRTQTNLADALTIAKPPLGKVVDRLEQEGWVERHADAKDRRVKRVYLTKKVEPLIEPLEGIVDELSEEAMLGMSQRDRTQLFHLLGIAHANLTTLVNDD